LEIDAFKGRTSRVLDIEQHDQLIAYLRSSGHIAPDEAPSVHTLAGGVSNKTVLVEFANGDGWVIKQALAKLRVAVDWYSDPERVHREALGTRWLMDLAPSGAITDALHEDHAHHLFIMRAVPQPHENWKTLLLAGHVNPDHIAQFGRLLGTIHRRSREQRDMLAEEFSERSFFESLRLEPYYAYALAQVPEARFLEALISETRNRRFTLVHGDYSPKNVLVHDGRLVLLDHEVIHWGDPAFDVGFSLTHLLSKAHALPAHRDAFVQAAFDYWRAYREALAPAPWDPDLETYAVRHTLGCLLARVAGRSPLEYLDTGQRARQRAIVLTLAAQEAGNIPDLIHAFHERLNAHADD
jgi:5-methylthioribose kinase